MSRLTASIIVGLIIGFIALFTGNYILKHFLYTYVVPNEILEAQTKPPLKLVNELLPQSLEINQQGTDFIISWKTPQPVKSAVVFTQDKSAFTVYLDQLKNTNKALSRGLTKRLIQHTR